MWSFNGLRDFLHVFMLSVDWITWACVFSEEKWLENKKEIYIATVEHAEQLEKKKKTSSETRWVAFGRI